ncbi:MAG: signal peptidase I [Verrucomicrobia bacterium]|nr:signal peptidase I [Verrucomicrobiota bacterium]
MVTDTAAAQPPTWIQRVLIGRNPKRTLVRIIVLVVVCIVMRQFVILPVRVEGRSMLPTYKDRGVHFVYRLAYLFHEPRRGDVVAIRTPAGEHVMYMKRIIGLPGETVAFHQGRLYISGKPLDEPYVKLKGNWDHEAQPVGPNQVYVVGDNRDMPWAYHEKGRPTRDLIVGKVVL